MFPEKFAALVGGVAKGPVQVTLLQLADIMEIDNRLGVLGRIGAVCQQLSHCSLELVPDPSKGEIELARTLQFTTDHPDIKALSDIRGGEQEKVEFKSTLLFDIKKFAHVPTLGSQEYRNDEVTFAVLKTIAAFLNSEGGRLYVGVADDGTILGLEADLKLKETATLDKWQLFFRDTVSARFKDGDTVNDYVRVDVCEIVEKRLARIDVSPRAQLSFLKRKDSYLLFRRQGNRTMEVDICEIEEFLDQRYKKLSP